MNCSFVSSFRFRFSVVIDVGLLFFVRVADGFEFSEFGVGRFGVSCCFDFLVSF